MDSNKFTVTIGIPAFNEEQGIVALLRSIISQTAVSYTLSKVLLISDGSTDHTVSEAKSVNDKRIEVIDNRQRLGRIARRNQLLRKTDTDIFIFLDGDGYIENEYSIEKIISQFGKNKKLLLVGGNPYSIGDGSFFSKCLSITRDAYLDMRYKINCGNNIYGCFGSMLAMRKELYESITIPSDINADDAFIYLTNRVQGNPYLNVRDARVIHHFPKTIAAHVKRNKRHIEARSELKMYFSSELVDREYLIPEGLYLKSTLKQFSKYPIHAICIFLINFYIAYIT
jgi:glycosyltransferase involved in cell wall biosynthesis